MSRDCKVHALFDKLEIQAGDVVYLQSSFSRLGFLELTPEHLLTVLIDRLGPSGTLVLPSFAWHLDPTARPWVGYRRYFDERPIFDVRNTTANIGVLPEVFRHFPGTRRSVHPCWSVCAIGRLAGAITSGQYGVVHPYGPDSSFGLLALAGCLVVGLGVTLNTTSLAPVVDYILGPAHTQQVFTSDPESAVVIDESGQVVSSLSHWLLPEVVRSIKPSALFELSPELTSKTRRADDGETIVFAYPYAAFEAEALQIGRAAAARRERMAWLQDYPLKVGFQAA